ncbi:hypothetical protein RRG08_031470 [Elysia crispata]|uniref:Uncharacterized protein n=1 Tax=Elysia crispata TaxID=231223 RepID=A0AAE0ZP77_9GAST|nr:hypothetical protein RRG08_031470 [Elysia crispata]
MVRGQSILASQRRAPTVYITRATEETAIHSYARPPFNSRLVCSLIYRILLAWRTHFYNAASSVQTCWYIVYTGWCYTRSG